MLPPRTCEILAGYRDLDFVTAAPTGRTFRMEVRMRHTIAVEPRGNRVPSNDPLPIHNHPQRPTGEIVFIFKSVEHKVSQAVDNGPPSIDFRALRNVRVAPDDRVRPRIDHLAGKRSLPLIGRLVLRPPVHVRNHDITLV